MKNISIYRKPHICYLLTVIVIIISLCGCDNSEYMQSSQAIDFSSEVREVPEDINLVNEGAETSSVVEFDSGSAEISNKDESISEFTDTPISFKEFLCEAFNVEKFSDIPEEELMKVVHLSLESSSRMRMSCDDDHYIAPLFDEQEFRNKGRNLKLNGSRLTDLDGIECLTNLEKLTLTAPYTPEMINCISKLSSLHSFELLVTEDISILNQLTGLSRVKLEIAESAGTLEFPHMPNLEYLRISFNDKNQFSSYDFLSRLSTLKDLHVSNVNSLDFLKDLTSLESLIFSNYRGSMGDELSLKFLNSPNLQVLAFSYVKVPSLDGLQKCLKLKTFECNVSELSNIDALANLKQLEKIRIRFADVVDITALGSLPNLRELYLDDNQIVDISPLMNNGSITDFTLMSNPLNTEIAGDTLLSMKKLEWYFDNFIVPDEWFEAHKDEIHFKYGMRHVKDYSGNPIVRKRGLS